jgi:hypothetical protein
MRYSFVLVPVLLLSLLISSNAQTNPDPAGTKPSSRSSKDSLKGSPPKLSLGAAVEKYSVTYDINADGTGRESLEIQKRCSTNECIELFSTFKQVFNSNLQKLKVVDAYLVKTNGKIIKVPSNLITDRPTPQTEAAPAFSSLRELEIKFPDWRMGDAAYVKVEGVTTKPLLDGRFDALEVFSLLFDWKYIEVNVTAPVGYEIFIDSAGLDGGKLADENGRSRWQFKKENVAKIDFEPIMNPLSVSPRFALTTFRNHADLGSALWQIFKTKAAVTPEIQALADEITKGASTPSQQASAIYDWVNRNIRYFFIVLDRGGWVPHDSTQIIKNGYGDCKDYTVLIHALLKAKGIDSVPVLIRSELGNWFPAVPTMDYFNHVILYIPSLKLFADATMPNTRLGLIPQSIVGKQAVLAGEKSGLIELPKDNPVDNQILSDVTYSFAESGSVKAQTRNTYVGRTEILFRPIFADTTYGKDPSTIVKLMLAFYGLNGDGKMIKSSDPRQVGEPFSVDFETSVEDFTTFSPTGKLKLPIGLNMINLAEMAQLATTDSRKTTLEIGASRLRENITIDVPSTVKIVAPPRSVNLNTAIGSFSVNPEIKDGKLHISRELLITKDSIEPSEYPYFKDLINKLVESNDLEIEYTADASILRAKSKERKAERKSNEPKSVAERMIEAVGRLGGGASLKASEVRELEAKVATNENDEDSRKKLLRHYAHYETKQTPAVQSAYLKHRLWLIENRPRLGDDQALGWSRPELPTASRDGLRNAWLASLAKAKADSTVRLNAIEFLNNYFPADAARLIDEGLALDPTNYKFPLLMTKVILLDVKKDSTEEQRRAIAKRLLVPGRLALGLIKKERSSERDSDRCDLLKVIGSAAVAAGDLDAAESFATELILDFGQSVESYEYDDATHLGNITLGRVALLRGNIEKAKEYLLVAIRAPLRKPQNSLFNIDMRLAKELYEKGVKAEVVEFLKLCLELGNMKTRPKVYEDEIQALKLWQDQIGKGIKPSFDFDAP